MTKSKLLTAGLIAAAMLAGPAAAREIHQSARQVAEVSAQSDAPYVDARACVPAPRVGAFATQPWDNATATPCEPAAAY
jgi:hypothetical protein